ncbi:MAG: hypothetical protein HUK14_01835 [Muribaculaceae bacterium]|nr:hypothetical protein [Muribaculaceae bacterium]
MKKILLSLAAAAMCLSANAAPWYLVGAFNGWDVANAPEMTEVESGVFEYNLDEMKSGFKIVDQQAWGGVELGAPSLDGVEINATEGYALAAGGYDIRFKDCDEISGATVRLVVDGENYTLYVRGEGVYTLPTLYLPGSWAQDDESDPYRLWAFNEETLMTKDGPYYSKVYNLAAEKYEFKVSAEGWAPQWAWYESQVSLSLDNPYVILDKKEGSDPGNVSVEIKEAGEYKFVFGYYGSSINLLKTSGIESIDVDNNVAPVYYNLQGVRVNNPENGLFIKVAGKNVSKVVL